MRGYFVIVFSIISAHSWAEENKKSKWDLTLTLGWIAPTIERRFSYRPEIDFATPSFVVVGQEGEFTLVGRGSAAFGGTVSYFFNDSFGVEGRIDTADFRIETSGPTFTATVDPPGRLPPFGATVELGAGSVEVSRLYPLSANLKYRKGDRARFLASGGFSYLPRFALGVIQEVGLGVTDFDGLERIRVRTGEVEVLSLQGDSGLIGFNVGAGVEFPISERVAILCEARLFYFQEKTFEWRTRPGLESLAGLESQLSPFSFAPVYFSVNGGIVFRF